jgi:hypothetical protein
MSMPVRFAAGPCAILAVCLSGCGSSPKPAGPAEHGRVELQAIWDMYNAYSTQNHRAPTKADDLKAAARGSPTAGRELNDPNFVILWGTPASGANVLAYQKDVPSQGGLVLLSDGTIKSMSADEFKSAPTAGK